MLLLFVLFAKIWAADGRILLGVELINGLVLEIEFCEAAAEAVDVLLLLSDTDVGRVVLLFSSFALTAVGLTG